LSAIVRGEHLEGKRQFIDIDGVEFVLKMLRESKSEKIKQKSILLIRDLVFYDSNLHLTYNSVEKY